MTTITKKELVEHAPKDHFDAEQWQRVYTDYAGGDFLFRRGVELAEKISFEVSMPGELWLDVGCGTGYLAARFNQSGRAVMGVDHDPAMIDSAKRRYINKCPTDKLNFITADAYHLPFDDATVDGVMATSLAGCLSFPDKFFREIYRVLRQGGFAVMTFTNRQSLLLKINSYFRNIMPSTGELKDNNFSFHLYEEQQVKKDLEKIGFAVVQVYYYNFFLNWGDRLLPPRSWAIRLENQKNVKRQRRLGRNFIITAQKV